MNVEISNTAPKTNEIKPFVQAAMDQVTQGVKNIAIQIVQDLIAYQPTGKNFADLANDREFTKLEKKLESSDEKTKMVYHKLFEASKEHIAKFSPPANLTLQMASTQTGDSTAGDKLLGTYVLPEASKIVEALKGSFPEALKHEEMWVTES